MEDHLIIACKVKHIMYRHFLENKIVRGGSSYTQGCLLFG